MPSQHGAFTRFAVVQHLRLFMHLLPDTVTAILAYDAVAVAFNIALNRMADITSVAPGLTTLIPFHIASYVFTSRRASGETSPIKYILLESAIRPSFPA